MENTPLVSVRDLAISFIKDKQTRQVVHNISFGIKENEIVGLVGESGSGKSVTALSLMGLLPKSQSQLSGNVYFENTDLLQTEERNLRKIRGNRIAMIFQEPMTALNPSLKCGYQVSEILQLHLNLTSSKAKKETI